LVEGWLSELVVEEELAGELEEGVADQGMRMPDLERL